VEGGKLLEETQTEPRLPARSRSIPLKEDVYPPRPTSDETRLDLNDVVRGAIRMAMELVLEEEMKELVGAGKWKRTLARRATRNGSYLRELVTTFGSVELRVPRTRESGSAGAVLGRYGRRSEEIDDAIKAAYVHGVSTRNMKNVTEALLGESVGRSTVSRITKTLDERVEALRTTPIEEPIVYLYLDATFLDARWARVVDNVSALVAYGVGEDGKRRLLGITIGPEESEDSWADLLQQLVDRGLHGVRLVISDAHAGLAKAVRRFLPEARHQRCVVHLERNVLAKVPPRLRARVGRELSRIFNAESAKLAKDRLDAFVGGLGKQVPEATEVLVNGFIAATQFFLFPKEHWKRIRSSNSIERLHGEIKRRIRSVGAFPDRASALRLITAVAIGVTDIWGARQYLEMSEEVKAELANVA
jgi:transposase-like protein